MNIRNTKYQSKIPQINYYLKNKNTPSVLKNIKSLLFASGGKNRRINLFSTSLEHLGILKGHKDEIYSLYPIISAKILASGSEDKSIKLWNIENKSLNQTLNVHKSTVSALCSPRADILISGDWNGCLGIWVRQSENTHNIYNIYKLLCNNGNNRNNQNNERLRIVGIVKINKKRIISGSHNGDMEIWDVDKGECIEHIGGYHNNINQIKRCIIREKKHLLCCMWERIVIWDMSSTQWEVPHTHLNLGTGGVYGWGAEVINGSLLFVGGGQGRLLSTALGVASTLSLIPIHTDIIRDVIYIATNLLLTASDDGYLQIYHPILRKLYFIFHSLAPIQSL